MVNDKSKSTCNNLGYLRVLFFHNTLPEYRIQWFMKLANKANIKFVFTNEYLNRKNYGFNIDYDKVKNLDCTFISNGIKGFKQLYRIIIDIRFFDFVELPSIDTLREAIISAIIIFKCKCCNVKVGYFWEKWEAPKDKQPLKRKIKNFLLRLVHFFVYKYVDVLFSVGLKNKAYFISCGVSENKIYWVPNVSETPKCKYEDIRAKFDIDKDKKLILYLGRVLPQKGVRNLIKSISMLDETAKNSCCLLVAGDGEDLNYCKSLATSLNLSNIRFSGKVVPSERGNYFSQCDIFVYPVTYYKGWVDVWGLTLNEALQHCKFIIATEAVGSSFELIENNVNGFRIRPDSLVELTESIKKSINNNKGVLVKTKSLELIHIYNYENMADVYLSIVRSLL